MDAKNPATKHVKDNTENQLDKAVDKSEKKFEEIKGKVSSNILNIADKVQERADSSQNFLDNKAQVVGKYVHRTVDKANKLGQRAADAISGSSEYIKNFDIDKARESVKVAIKDKPEVTIAVAAALGLLVGYLVGRKTA